MAKRKDYDLNNYSKYRRNSQSFSKGTRDFFRVWGLANIAHNQSEAKRKRRRKELDRKIKEDDKKLAELREKSSPMTASEIIVTIIMLVIAGVIGTIFIDSALNYGIWEALKITFIVIMAIVIIVFIIYYIVKGAKNSNVAKSHLSKDEIFELQKQLEIIDKYKEIVNTSTNVTDVKNAMDELLKIIDFIMTYDEEDLHEAGMTKQYLPEQKQFILDNYDVILKQVIESTELTN